MPYADPVKFRAMRERQNEARRRKTAEARGDMPKRTHNYLDDPKPAPWNGDEDFTYDFRQSPAFGRYRKLIEKTLKKLKGPVTIREIHSALGENAIQRYTYDALETSNNVLWFKGYIDRFLWFKGVAKPLPMLWTGNGQLAIAGKPKSVSADLGLTPRVTA